MANTIRIKRRLSGGNAGAPVLEAGEFAVNFTDNKLYIGDGSTAVAIAGKGEFVDLGSVQSVTGKKNFTAATVSTAPSDANDLVRKTDLDAVASSVSSLGSAFNYVGVLTGGANSGNAFDLSELDETDAGDYYKVTTAGYFILSPASAFFANVGDGIVFNSIGGVDKIDNTDSNVSGTANYISVTGSTDTGFTVDVDTDFKGRVTSLETTSAGLGTMSVQDADTVAITGGSINGTTIGATTASSGAFTTITASSTATLNTLASSGATLTGGTIDGMVIGGTTTAAGSFTAVTASGNITANGNIVGDGSTEIQDCILDGGVY
jgi:hypothetical protein